MIAILLVCVACAAYWLWTWKTMKHKEPPCYPGAWPILGHISSLVSIKDSCSLLNLLYDLAKYSNDMGGVILARLANQTHYIITDPDDCLKVANTCLEKDTYYNFVAGWLGHGLFSSRYSIWKSHRKLLNPAFSQTVLDTFIGVFNSQSRKLLKDFDKEVGKGFFDHFTYIRHNALETICLTSLGVDFTDPNLNSEYLKSMDRMWELVIERFLKFWWHNDYMFAWSRLKKEQDACLKILHKMSNTVLQKKKSKLYENKTGSEKNITGTNFRPFIDLLLDLSVKKGAFTDKEIREHVDTMLVAGQDTSATVLLFTTLLLGSHPEAQEKVFIEVQQILGGDRDVEKADLSKLVYLEASLKESMRLYSIGPAIARKIDTDVKLKNCTLQAGSTCWLLYLGVHLHPMWGPDVHEFHPERWLEPGRLPENPNAFAAFSLGKRNCIGKAYAMMSMKTTLAHVVRRYRIKADITKLRLKVDPIIKPLSGHFISIEKRT